jgi:pilus assembly protein CpaC
MLTQYVLPWARTTGSVLAFVIVCCAAQAFAQNEPPRNSLIYRVTAKNVQLTLTEKESRLLELPNRIKTVDGFDPAIVKITTVDNFHQVRVLAVTPGFTQIILVDEQGQSYTVDLLINGDVKQFQALIRQAAPGSSVQAIKVKDAVLLLGWVDQAGQATKIVELAEMHFTKVLNYLQVSGVQTIMLRVRMMEAQRSKIRALGFNFLQLRQHSYVGSLPGTLVPFSNSTPSNNLANPFGNFIGPVTSAVNPAAATAVFGTVANDNAFQGFIEALRQESLLTVLAEPNLTTTNGRPANFLDGGQFPVPIPQGLGTVSIQYKSFGVQLEFVPTILSSGRLRMSVSPEVSQKDLSNTVTVQGITVPSLTTRRVNTEVEMNFGETLIVAGLISQQVQATTSKIPFLGELPWIGAAFRRVAHNEAETELIVLVTPELVSPVDESLLPDGPGRGTTSPTDRELYFNGYLETQRYAPDPTPPPTWFGFPPDSASPPPVMGPPNMAPPGPAYDVENLRSPAPAVAPPPPANGNGAARPAAPAPAPQPPEGDGAAGTDEAAPDKAQPTSATFPARRNAATRRITASSPPTKPIKPTRVVNRPGPIVPASGVKAPANGAQDAADDSANPGLITP